VGIYDVLYARFGLTLGRELVDTQLVRRQGSSHDDKEGRYLSGIEPLPPSL
jgi:hypothetical protein